MDLDYPELTVHQLNCVFMGIIRMAGEIGFVILLFGIKNIWRGTSHPASFASDVRMLFLEQSSPAEAY